MNGVTTIAALVDLLALGLSGLWAGSKLSLFTNVVVPSPTTLPADLTPPTLTGYADKTVAWNTVGYDPTQGIAVAAGTMTYEWSGPADATGQPILGWALLQPGAAGPPIIPNVVLSCGNFTSALPLIAVTDRITLAVTVNGNGNVAVTLLS